MQSWRSMARPDCSVWTDCWGMAQGSQQSSLSEERQGFWGTSSGMQQSGKVISLEEEKKLTTAEPGGLPEFPEVLEAGGLG
ncbi:hypothetical protein NDU88_007436 [Pleurodeles waltl]|uniref:Uncharacterized protein n=1 Tax=Pleurodeles waltl TaxID=8319 RepID=A0AAV7WHN9_PLEWA|nr:hypothetical protein NDU88_007436 [Pleurodeles waltl]